MNGLWNLKDIQNSRQNSSKNILVRENAVTRVRESCSLRVMCSWLNYITSLLSEKNCDETNKSMIIYAKGFIQSSVKKFRLDR